MNSKSIRIFLAEGNATGLRVAEIGMSTCKAVVAPRASLGLLSQRAESHKTGVYLPKAHARYLEAKLVALAKDAKRCTVVNRTAPDGGALPEADAADMDEFVGQLRILSSILGVQAFEAAPATESGSRGSSAGSSPTPIFQMAGNGYNATCQIIDGEFVVQSGSIARIEKAPTLSPSSRAARKDLLASAVLQRDASGLKFVQNYAFGSPSGSAQVICGANVNGRSSWRLPSGETFRDWQDNQLMTASPTPTR